MVAASMEESGNCRSYSTPTAASKDVSSSDTAHAVPITAASDDLTSAAAAGQPYATATAAAATAATRRIYYLDWLRVFLTVLVLVFHCITEYDNGGSKYLFVHLDPKDMIMHTFYAFFFPACQAYFMGLFFLLSGYCTPGSYWRKGPVRWLLDRTLRLMVPTIIYSLTFPPLMWWLNVSASPKHPQAKWTLGQTFAAYFTDTSVADGFNIANGPVWFTYMLFWFSVGYVIVQSLLARLPRKLKLAVTEKGHQDKDKGANGLPRTVSPTEKSMSEFSMRWMFWAGAGLILLLTAQSFIIRAATAGKLQPYAFWRPLPVVNLQPSYFGQYVTCFVLGILAYKHQALARLPSRCGFWCLAVAGIWWVEAGFVPFAASSMVFAQRILVPLRVWLPAWLYHTFVEQSFAVVWSLGLLVVFRDCFNTRPGRFGVIVIGAAYTAYIIHPMFVALFGRAMLGTKFPTLLINALAIAPMVVISSWLVAAAVKAVPGVHRVL